MKKHSVEIRGMRVHALHGCMEEEGIIGTEYRIDVSVMTDFTDAAEEDNLSKTIDYVQVAQIVKEEMSIRSKLIEHVAARIVKRLKKLEPVVYSVSLRITKLNPPVHADVPEVAVMYEE